MLASVCVCVWGTADMETYIFPVYLWQKQLHLYSRLNPTCKNGLTKSGRQLSGHSGKIKTLEPLRSTHKWVNGFKNVGRKKRGCPYTNTHTHCYMEQKASETVTPCGHASSKTIWTQYQWRSWLGQHDCANCKEVRASYARGRARFHAMHRLSAGSSREAKTEHQYLLKPLAGSFPSRLQHFLLRDAPPVGPCLFLWINMIHAAVSSHALINKQTAGRKPRDITYSWGTCRFTTVKGKTYF